MKTIDKTKVVTDIVRFNYPNIYEPVKQEETGECRYSLSILIPKEDTKNINKINSSIFEAKTQGLKEWEDIPDNIKIPLRDGELIVTRAKAEDDFYIMDDEDILS